MAGYELCYAQRPSDDVDVFDAPGWYDDGEDFDDPNELIHLTKSEFVESFVYFEGQEISFEKYIVAKEFLDTDELTIVYKGGRQVSKSMTLSCDIISDVLCKPYYYVMYYAPTVDHVRTFSIDRIEARTEESEFIKTYYINKRSKACVQNVHERGYINRSRIYFRAESQLESIRGKSCHKFVGDEAQDLTLDGLTVAERVLDGKEGEGASIRLYAGTAKTIHTILETRWRESNQIYPVLICPECRSHNIPDVDMIKPKGLSCKCGALLSVRPPNMYLKFMEKSQSAIAGFWVPQIILPLWIENKNKYAELYHNKMTYPTDRFMNEIMGISTGQGTIMITEEDLINCTKPDFPMWEKFRGVTGMDEMYAGVDWAATGGRVSFTVLVIGFWHRPTNRFCFVYMKKFVGNNAVEQVKEIANIIKTFRCKKVITDWGNGWAANDLLRIQLGPHIRVHEVFYVRSKAEIVWDIAAQRWNLCRTLSLLFFFKQIRGVKHPTTNQIYNKIWFFKLEQFKDYIPDFLAEYAEYSEDKSGNELIKFDHPETIPDDILQACNITFSLFMYLNSEAKNYFT